jgi:serine/threonine-protein kinase
LDDIGRYRIIGELGSGGMGIVYRAYDPVLSREVAIKTLKLSELSDPAERDALRERLAREARAAAALSHAGIVTIHDVVQQDGDHISLVMERIEGHTLAHVMAGEPPLEIQAILRIIREAAAALDYAHRKGIVHRDIKPANIMLDEGGAVKIADFGIAKITTSQTRTQSASGLIVGTAGYMSPEQLRGATIEGFADQFSLGVVAYEMLARRRPFMADSLIALTHQVVFEEAPALSTVRPGLGMLADAVFQKALSKSSADRYPSCSAFAAALELQVNAGMNAATLVMPAPLVLTPPPSPPPTRPLTEHPTRPLTQQQTPPAAQQPPSRSTWLVAIMALLIAIPVVGLIVGGIYFMRRNPGTPAHPNTVAKALPPTGQPPPTTATSQPTSPDPVPPAPSSATPEPVKPVVALSTPPPAKTPATAASVPQAGTVHVNKKDGQKYVWIEAGSFTMGCVPNDAECGGLAKPAHRVTISTGFWMEQTPTTTGAYRSFSLATHRELPKTPRFNPDWSLDEHPMVEVTWDDANAYCSRAGGRLPTEAEWEYAARGGATTIFPWGNEASHDFANFGQGTDQKDAQGAVEGKDRWLYTSPVESFPPNGFHLYDMTGNVTEWCADWFSAKYYRDSPERDPKGPESGSLRVERGGSWKSPAKLIHTSLRMSRKPEEHGMTTGFRCVVNSLP